MNVDGNRENEKREVLLAAMELRRQSEEHQREDEEFRLGEMGKSHPEWITDVPQEIEEEFEESEVALKKLLSDVLGGKIKESEMTVALSVIEEKIERTTERLHRAGDIDAIMMHRAEKEAEMKGLTLFGQLLVRSAFKACARGVGEEDWVNQVLNVHANALDESWAREEYRRTVTFLRAQGPWPWPQG